MTPITPLSDRPKSGFPVSIPTGLALQTIFDPVQPVIDPDRLVPPKAIRGNYNTYLFNISTLLRNLISSIPGKELMFHSQQAIFDTLLEEIEYLTHFFRMNDLNISFYVHTYNYVLSKYKDQIRAANTENQKYIQAVNDFCFKKLKGQDDVLHFTKHLEPSRGTAALLLTHVPWDLLSHHSFLRLDLLESHTGVIKTRKDWNSKYFKIKDHDLSNLPFIESLLTTLGDSVMFQPFPLNERLKLVEKLKQKNVHPLMDEMTYKLLTST